MVITRIKYPTPTCKMTTWKWNISSYNQVLNLFLLILIYTIINLLLFVPIRLKSIDYQPIWCDLALLNKQIFLCMISHAAESISKSIETQRRSSVSKANLIILLVATVITLATISHIKKHNFVHTSFTKDQQTSSAKE